MNMSTEVILQIVALVLGMWFTYTGGRTLFSKRYYVNKIESNKEESVSEAYKKMPSSRILFTRYGLGVQWLVLGIGFLALLIYSLVK